MLDVCGHARQLFADVAALDEDCHFLKHSLLIELRAGNRRQPLRQTLLVALFDLRAQFRNASGSCGKPIQRAAQNRLESFAFASTHDFQLLDERNHLLQSTRGERGQVVVLAVFTLQGSGQTQGRVQIWSAIKPVLAPRGVKRVEIARNQITIESGPGLDVAFESEGQIDVAADEILLQNAAQLHFQGVKARRKPELKIEKAMIDAFYGERVTELIVIACWHANLHARKSGHRRNGHAYSCASGTSTGALKCDQPLSGMSVN